MANGIPNIKSAMKRTRSQGERAQQGAEDGAGRLVIKKFDAAVAEGQQEAAAGTIKLL
ncbi:MAG: hypothetical protein ACLUEK_15900 [Oscillospiraceae bacterium]